jgi:parallel beta-helix repeat protein
MNCRQFSLLNRAMKLLLFALLLVVSVDVVQTQSITDFISLNGPVRTPTVYDISLSHNSIAYSADTLRLMKTTDGGVHWSATPTVINNPHLVSVNRYDENRLVVAKGDTVFYSGDGGLSWIPKITTSHANRFARSPDDDTISASIVWAGLDYYEENNQQYSSLYSSYNDGIFFREIRYFRDTVKTNITDIAIRPGNSDEVWVTGTNIEVYADSNGVWKTTNAGSGAYSSWQHVRITGTSRSVKFTSVTIDAEGRIFVGTALGDIYRCIDTSANIWTKVLNNTSSYNVSAFRVLDENRMIAMSYKNIFISSSHGETWEKLTIENITQGFTWKKPLLKNIAIEYNNPDIWYLGAATGLYKTTDAGTSWNVISTGTKIIPSDNVCANNNYVFSVRLPKIVKKRKEKELAGVDRYSINNNEWKELSFGVYDDSEFVCKKIFCNTDGKVYAMGAILKRRGVILVSNDNGDSWSLAYHSAENGSDFYGMTKRGENLLAFGKKITDSSNIIASNDGILWIKYPYGKIVIKGAVFDVAAVDDNENAGVIVYALVDQADDKLCKLTYESSAYSWSQIPNDESNNHFNNVAVHSVLSGSDKYFIADKKYLYDGSTILFQGGFHQTIVFDNIQFAIKAGNPDDILMRHADSLSWVSISQQLYNNNVSKVFNMWAQPTGTAGQFYLYCSSNQGIFRYEICTTCFSGSAPIVSNPPLNNNVIIRRGETEYFTRDVIIPSGAMFKMEPDALALFEEGVTLRVEGEVIIQGAEDNPAKLHPAYPAARWGGIYLVPGASASIDYVDIQGTAVGVLAAKANIAISNSTIRDSRIGVALYGMDEEPPLIDSSHFISNAWGVVMVNGAQALLNGNTISNNQKGILIDASSPLLYGNTIEENSQVGIAVYGRGFPRFGDIALHSSGMNIVQNNALTQLMTVNGYAFLGFLRRDCVTELGGGNLIAGTNPDEPLCVAMEQSVISSLATDWGMATLSQDAFLQDANSQIMYECIAQSPHTDAEIHLWEALEHRSLGAYSLSEDKYIDVLYNPEARTEQALQALAGLTSVVAAEFETTEEESVLVSYRAVLDDIAQNHTAEDVRYAALQLLARDASRNDNEYIAYEKFLYLATLPMSDDATISSLLSKNIFESTDLDYDDEALATAEEMNTLYPEDERAQLAGVLTEVITKHSLPQQFAKRRKFTVAMRKFPSASPHLSTLPKEFALYQNYPNPFNPATTIRFDVPKETRVEITIYDLLGRKVTTLLQDTKPAGRYAIQWNGSAYSSGVYYVKMSAAGRFSQMKKIMLLK